MRNFSKAVLSVCIVAAMLFSSLSAAAVTESEIETKYQATYEYLLSCQTPQVGSIGGEWMVLGLARSGKISRNFAEGYYQNVLSYVQQTGSAKLDRNKATENARVILALTSIGKGVNNVAGYNLLEPLADFNFVKKQGLNGPVWTLLAFDSLQYEIPVVNTVKVQTTREMLIEYILQEQTEDFGWTFDGSVADPDMTSMVICALAPYYEKNSEIKAAIDNALEVLSAMQTENGDFKSYGSASPESNAQVLTALCSLGIDAATDERFVKNGKTVFDGLMRFSVEKGFEHSEGQGLNQMSTEQAFYALTAYDRMKNNRTSLYEMCDLFIQFDVNLDGAVTIVDATAIQKYVAKLENFSLRQLKIADANHDGKIDITDATAVQKHVAGYR